MSQSPIWPRLNLAAGSVQVMDQTLRDAARPVLYHYDPAFIELFAHASDLMKQVYRTQYDVVIMQGEALLGLEAAAASLIRPGDKVLNLVSGVFGKWFEDFIERFGGGRRSTPTRASSTSRPSIPRPPPAHSTRSARSAGSRTSSAS